MTKYCTVRPNDIKYTEQAKVLETLVNHWLDEKTKQALKKLPPRLSDKLRKALNG